MAQRPTRRTKPKKASVRKKPTKRRRRKKPSSRFWPLLGLIGLFLALGLILVYLYRPSGRFQYQLSQRIDVLDTAIHSCLFELGFSKRDILSRQSVLRTSGTLSWKATSIELQLPKRTSFSQIKTHMKRDLTHLDRDVSLRFTEGPSQPSKIEVLTGDLLTHNLIFRLPKVRVPKKKVGPRIAIIIDDMGPNRRRARQVINLEAPLT
ncbi:MAG: hypothetical protein JSW70_03490, partial [Syntrophobacterales bacterium]